MDEIFACWCGFKSINLGKLSLSLQDSKPFDLPHFNSNHFPFLSALMLTIDSKVSLPLSVVRDKAEFARQKLHLTVNGLKKYDRVKLIRLADSLHKLLKSFSKSYFSNNVAHSILLMPTVFHQRLELSLITNAEGTTVMNLRAQPARPNELFNCMA
ncbi:hypothetical protein TNIN_473651 [Trichonephila inaurata madagascariensis]|uniref:Uncharacterized protein n=1 Tax=Trichonephila inaurata madagascariensis TaxID=2747483 RepID=A0A8X7BUK7_9ARAC|nr:hypothetical protein TNIN_473651 [Trichonephila inaurata madagascariensis]